MRFLYAVGLFALFFGAVLWPTASQATHVRAGEITTRRLPGTSLTYEITFTPISMKLVGGRPLT